VQKRDLAAWQKEYRGKTAEEVARRVIAQCRPSEEEISREAGGRRGGGGGQSGDGGGDKCGDASEVQELDLPGDAGTGTACDRLCHDSDIRDYIILFITTEACVYTFVILSSILAPFWL
jgi:hypothetical protein